jgi:DNA-binding beta-propeller fold protein YncE
MSKFPPSSLPLCALLGALALSIWPASPARAQVVPPNPPPSFASHVGGSWGPILVWPHVPVSIANLPDGRILTFSSNEPNSFPGSSQDEYTHAAVWDPETGTIHNVPHPSHDMFCAALVMLESGEPFVMGGRNQGDSPWTSFYDFRNDQWVQIENMNRGRWYPTAVYLGNGEVFIAAGVGGGVNPERWSPLSGWRLLTGINLSGNILQFGDRDGSGSWPLLQLAPNGTVFHHGANDRMNSIDPFGGALGLGTISDRGPHNFGWYPDEGVSVLYDVGKILVAGGSVSTASDTAVAGAWKIDLNGPAPVLTPAAAMNFPRQFQNEVMLPTGQVLVVGGNTNGVKFTDDLAVKSAEAWNPATNGWTLLNAQNQARAYHSTALLMTDGRVLSAGGGLAGNACTSPEPSVTGECGADHWNAEVFSPPYLFAPNGSLAPRPVIEAGPGVARVGGSFAVQATAGATEFSMVRMSATTHTMNTDQRFLRPSFVETSPGSYQVTLHANENVLVPGYWMLFALRGGVPSVAHVIQVVNDGTPRGTPVAGLRHRLGEAVLVPIEAEDPDGNPLVFGATGLPPGLSIDAETGVIDGTTSAPGVYDVVVTAFDGTEAGIVSFPWVVSSERTVYGTVSVNQSNPNTWHTVTLPHAFQDPIVVMGPPSYQDAAPATVRVRNVGPTSFQFRLEEWDYQDGPHGTETVSYLVVEAGAYHAPGGGTLVAGRSTGIDYENARIESLPVGGFGVAPLVFAQAVTANGARAIVAKVTDVTTASFAVRIEGEDALTNNIPIEDVHWIALEPAAIPGVLQAGRLPTVDENPDQINYSQGFPSAPHLFAAAQTRNGNDTIGLRHSEATTSSVRLRAQEEESDDAEVNANNVVVAWLAIHPNLPSLGLLPLFNRPPVVAGPHAQDGEVGDDVSLQVQAADPDGDAIEFSASGLPPGLAIDPDTGEITGTLASPDTHVVTVRATDSSNAIGEAEFVFTVRARLEALPFPAPPMLVGGTVSYTAQTNLAGNFVYQWDFGDGSVSAPSSSPEMSHTYAAPGRYVVTLTITDPVHGSQDQLQFVQNVTAAATPLRPTSSSSIIYEAARNRVWVVDPDNDAVRVIDALSQTGLAVIPVCADPRTLALAGNGQIWVACKDAAAVDRIDPVSLAVVGTVPLPWGSQPHGLVFDPTGAFAFVALEASGRILKLNGASGAALASAEVGRHVRHLAVTADGSWLHATRFVTPLLPNESQGAPQVALAGGELLRLHTATLALDRVTVLEASMDPDSEQSARGIPNYLGAPAISPQGDALLVPSKQDNVLRGRMRDGLDLGHDSTVRAITSRVDAATGAEIRIARVDHDNASIASATAWEPSGAYAFTALEGNRAVSVMETFSHFEIGRVGAGRAPQGLVVSPDGQRLYVDDFMDRTVSVFALADLVAYDEPMLPKIAVVAKGAAERLPPAVLLGKKIFYDAADPRLALENYMACASCHNDGDQDGRVWDFAQFGEGMRNTITLRGHGLGHGRLHWSANFDEVQDFEGQIRGFARGIGLMSNADFAATSAPLGPPKAGRSADLDALAAYVGSLGAAGRSPHRAADGSLTADALAGREVFASSGCVACHGGVAFSDSATGAMHDVGTLRPSSGPQTALDTPTLRGVWETGPYLHDGSRTLEGAVLAHSGVSLPAPQLTQLVAYLNQIDDDEVQAPNGAPSVADPGDQASSEGDAVSLVVVASDPEGDTLTFAASGLPGGLAIDPASGAITGTLGFASAGSYAVTVTVRDELRVASATFDWVVANLNRPPVFETIFLKRLLVGEPRSQVFRVSDPDGDPVTVTASGLPPGLTWHAATRTATGTPVPGSAGTYTVTLEATDGVALVPGVFQWTVKVPQCSNGIDDDGDAAMDHPADPQCMSPTDDTEGAACGLGFEVVFAVGPIMALRRRMAAKPKA